MDSIEFFIALHKSPLYATVEEILDCFATFVANKNINVSCMLHAWIKTALYSGEICHVLVPIHSPISIPYFWGSTGPTVLDMDSKKNKFSWHNPSVSPWSNWKRKSKCLGSHTEMTKSSCHTWLELEWDYIILIELGLLVTPLKNDLDGTDGKKIKEAPSSADWDSKNGCFPLIFTPMTGRQKSPFLHGPSTLCWCWKQTLHEFDDSMASSGISQLAMFASDVKSTRIPYMNVILV